MHLIKTARHLKGNDLHCKWRLLIFALFLCHPLDSVNKCLVMIVVIRVHERGRCKQIESACVVRCFAQLPVKQEFKLLSAVGTKYVSVAFIFSDSSLVAPMC